MPNSGYRMKFETYLPCVRLRPFVQSFAVQELDADSTYKVLPDTAVVIGFQYRGRLSLIMEDKETPLSISGISGLTDRLSVFRNSPDIGTVLVFFKEAGAASFFRQPLHELFRESVSLDNFMLRSELLCLEEQLAGAATDRQRISFVEQFLISRMNHTIPDPLVLTALALIHKSKGSIRVKELAGQLCISQGPLEKRFRQAVGASPKKFASIIRFRHIIRQYDPARSLTDLSYEAGFYDQAHFIKAFKVFTGQAPEQFFSDSR